MNSFNTLNDCSNDIPGILSEKHISVLAGSMITGYNAQYLRRMLRRKKLEGTKVGQLWLIKMKSIQEYLQESERSSDQRFGPKPK